MTHGCSDDLRRRATSRRSATCGSGGSKPALPAAATRPRDPVVLIHGLGTNDLWWTPTIPVLATERTGSSRSTWSGSGGAPASRSASTSPRISSRRGPRRSGSSRATFVGHSMGGLVTADLAARHPEVVERLVLVDAAGLPISQRVIPHLMNFVRASPFMPAGRLPDRGRVRAALRPARDHAGVAPAPHDGSPQALRVDPRSDPDPVGLARSPAAAILRPTARRGDPGRDHGRDPRCRALPDVGEPGRVPPRARGVPRRAGHGPGAAGLRDTATGLGRPA